MPPRKRIVKKIVKKVVKKPSPTTETSSPPPFPADTEPATDPTPPSADTNLSPKAYEPAVDETPATMEPSPTLTLTKDPAKETLTEEPVAKETLSDEPLTAGTLSEEAVPAGTLSEEPVAAGTLSEEPVTAGTLSGEPVPAGTLSVEPVTAGTLAEEPVTAGTLAEEPSTVETIPEESISAAARTLEPEPPATAEAPAASEVAPKTKTKTVLRVRKVVKKKIVKKLIPKPCLASSAAAVIEDVKEAKPETAPVEANPREQSELGNPSSDAAPVSTEEAEPEKTVVDSENQGDAGKEDNVEAVASVNDEEGLLERSKRRKTEIFIGGLDRDAKEEDLRNVFGKAGEIVEVRMIMDVQSGKNKGYAFLRYAEVSQAKKAVADFEKVKVCGKICGASALKGNDTIFLGNIDKKWKKEDIIKSLQQVGIEKIETVTVMVDPNNADTNRGFAFLELESNKDAQIAYKKLQKKDAFGKGRNIKVAWAEPFNDPDEDEMKKVKSVYAEGIPSYWDEGKVRETFKKFGEIERVVLARNIPSAKRKDFAFVNYTTRQAALLCIEYFDKETTDNDSKITLKVSLAKPAQKGRQNKGGSKSADITEKPKPARRDTKANISSTKGMSFKGNHTRGGEKSSTSHELSHGLREQATWRQGQMSYAGGAIMHDYAHGSVGKRHFSSLGDEASYSDLRGYPRARLEHSFPAAGSSYGAIPPSTVGSSFPYYQHQGAGYAAGSHYGSTDYRGPHQTRQGAPPYGSSYYSRY